MRNLIIVFVAIVIGFGFLIKYNNDKKAERIAIQQVENKRKEKLEELKKDGLSEATAEKLLTVKSKVDRQQVNEIVKTLSEWTDAMKLASSTSRISLSQPISKLQEIKRDLSAKKYTDECSNILQSQSIEYMNYGIEAFLEFLKDNEYEADKNLEMAATSRKDVQSIIYFCELDL